MKIPKTVMVRGVPYEVRWKWNLRHRGEKLDGLCDRDEPVIFLDRLLAGDERELTFVHELLHAVIAEMRKEKADESGQKKKMTKRHLSYQVEEDLVREISEFICETFKLRLK